MREAWLEAPWTVRAGLLLMLATLATGAVASLFAQTWSSDDLAFSVVSALIGIAIVLGFISRLLVGRNWARVLLTVLVAAGVLVSVLDVVGRIYAFTPLTLALNVPNVLAVVLLWLPPSRPHFSR